MTSCELYAAPAVEPVLLDEMKAQLRLSDPDEDELVAGLITAARQWAEQYTGRALINQTWRLWMDRDQGYGDAIVLPHAPLSAVNAVSVFDESDNGVACAASTYFVDKARQPGRVVLRSGAVWPVPTRLANGMMVEYVTGYGADESAVPAPLRLAIKQLVCHWYEHRGEELLAGSATDSVSTRYGSINVPLMIQALLNPYRIIAGRLV